MKKLIFPIMAATIMTVTACKEESANPTLTTTAASDVTITTATLGGNISNAGNPAYIVRGVCYGVAENPVTSDNKEVVPGSGTGNFSVDVSELEPLTTYYARAYVITETSIFYGNQVSFTTVDITPPVLATIAASNITATSAILGVNVTNAGNPEYIVRGVCYSTEENPVATDNKMQVPGSGTGSFTFDVSDLRPLTTYYVRAYVVTEMGLYYGNQVSFKTEDSEQFPPILTNDLLRYFVTSSTARAWVAVNITDEGYQPYTERGVCYGKESNPTVDDNVIEIEGLGKGEFNVELTGLDVDTRYYVRAYAINTLGPTYASQVSFTTTYYDFEPEMVFVEGGTYMRGMPEGAHPSRQAHEGPVHEVTLSDYCIGKFTVTQKQYLALMDASTTYFRSGATGDNYPVEGVSLNNAKEYVAKLNQLTGKKYRMPTDAEWEFAARGGNQTHGYIYSGSNTIAEVAVCGQSLPAVVGTKNPNELGIYDMSGNMYEIVNEFVAAYPSTPQVNPTGPTSGSYVVRRGGAFNYNESQGEYYFRVDHRQTWMVPNVEPSGAGGTGFRIAHP